MPITKEQRDVTTVTMLETAERLVSESGVLSLKVRDVAKEADVSVGSIYAHFKNLDGLIFSVNSRTIKRLDDALQETSDLSASGTVKERYVALALTYLRFARGNRRLWSALFEHRLPNDEPLPDWHLAEHVRMFRHIALPLQSMLPGLAEEERFLLARTIYSSVHGVVSINIESRIEAVPPEVLDRQMTVFVTALITGLEATGASA